MESIPKNRVVDRHVTYKDIGGHVSQQESRERTGDRARRPP